MKNRKWRIQSTALAFLAALAPVIPAVAGGTTERPNVVLIYADDLGYGDTSCYGAELIETPRIDRLAEEGMRFTCAYASGSLCTPSRYGLLTGRGHWRTDGKRGKGRLLIEPERMTLASLLHRQGYRTAAIGKWHLGYGEEDDIDWNADLKPGPLELGFDYHFGVPLNHNDGIRAYVENHHLYGVEEGGRWERVEGANRPLPKGLAQPRVDDEVDSTLTAKALEFIENNRSTPFFVYLALTATHTHVTPNARFRGTSATGTYGDYVNELDYHVGEIADLLDRLGLTENTLLVFTSDHGGADGDFRNAGIGLNLADTSGDIRSKAKTARKDARKAGHVFNAPWRGGKGDAFEGGFRVPFIVRWPALVEASTETGEMVCLTDVLATLAELFGEDLPENAGEDSFSFLPLLTSGEAGPSAREFVLLQSGQGDYALRQGDWKLIKKGPERKAGNRWSASDPHPGDRLFDLSRDPRERNNLAPVEPGRAQAMRLLLQRFLQSGRTRPEAPPP